MWKSGKLKALTCSTQNTRSTSMPESSAEDAAAPGHAGLRTASIEVEGMMRATSIAESLTDGEDQWSAQIRFFPSCGWFMWQVRASMLADAALQQCMMPVTTSCQRSLPNSAWGAQRSSAP